MSDFYQFSANEHLIPPFSHYSSDEGLKAFLVEGMKGLSTKSSKSVKVVFLGNGGTGKTSLIKTFSESSKYSRTSKFQQLVSTRSNNTTTVTTESTFGIDSYDGNILEIHDDVNYQVWDFAGV
jgi:GTPase SAR1 family protein